MNLTIEALEESLAAGKPSISMGAHAIALAVGLADHADSLYLLVLGCEAINRAYDLAEEHGKSTEYLDNCLSSVGLVPRAWWPFMQ